MNSSTDGVTTNLLQLETDLPSFVVRFILHLMVVLLHSCGLHFLWKIKRTRTDNMVAYSNKILLVLLSISELAYGILSIVCGMSLLMRSPVLLILSVVMGWLCLTFSASAIYLITLNRLLTLVHPIWYRRTVTKKKFVVGVVLVCVVVTTVLTPCQIVVMWYRYISRTVIPRSVFTLGLLVIDLTSLAYIIFCIFTYVFILIAIVRSRRDTQNDCCDNKSTTFQFACNFIKARGYTAPFLITLTHVVFNTVPTIGMTTCLLNDCSAYNSISKIWFITSPLNNLSDGLIYVLFDRDIRNHLKNKFTRRNTPQSDTDV